MGKQNKSKASTYKKIIGNPRKWQPTSVLLPGKSHGWRSLVGYSPWDHKESDKTERLHLTSLHFSIFTFDNSRTLGNSS